MINQVCRQTPTAYVRPRETNQMDKDNSRIGYVADGTNCPYRSLLRDLSGSELSHSRIDLQPADAELVAAFKLQIIYVKMFKLTASVLRQ
jgi:hypothetical protein